MFKHLLIPLDGSRLAEVALPAAVDLALKALATVTLLHIIERDAPETVHGERHLRTADEAVAYLDQIARQFFGGISTRCHVHTAQTKDVARGIADHQLEFEPDTVVMSAHGRGGIHRLLFGNIAQQVVALGSIPVLLIQPGDSFACRRVLLPHDGVPAHDSALSAGTALARLFGSEIRLVMVVPTRRTLSGHEAATGQLMPHAAHAVLETAEQDAASHLRDHVDELKAYSLSVEAEVLRGDPAACIVQTSHLFQADVIVLGTHGKAGAKAFWERSVAARVAMKTKAALLFVPVKKP